MGGTDVFVQQAALKGYKIALSLGCPKFFAGISVRKVKVSVWKVNENSKELGESFSFPSFRKIYVC